MAGPITWRNIQGPSAEDIFRGLGQAQRSFSTSFDALANLLSQREASLANQAQQFLDSQESGFLDRLQGFTSVDDLIAQRGALEEARMGLSEEARNRTRGSIDARIAALRDAAIQEAEFAERQADFAKKQRLREAEPYRQLVKDMMSRSSDPEVRDAIQNVFRYYDFEGEGDLAMEVRDFMRQLTEEGYADAEEGRKQGRYDSDMATAQLNRQDTRARMGRDTETHERLRRTWAEQDTLARLADRFAEKVQSWREEVNQYDLSGVPKDQRETDAFRRDRAIRELKEENPDVPARLIDQVTANADSLFDSTRFTSPIGQQASDREADLRMAAKAAEERRNTGLYATDSTEAIRNLPQIEEYVKATIPEGKTREQLLRRARSISHSGLKITDPETKETLKVYPSRALLELAIGMSWDTWNPIALMTNPEARFRRVNSLDDMVIKLLTDKEILKQAMEEQDQRLREMAIQVQLEMAADRAKK